MAAAARPRDAHPVNPRQPDLAVVERRLRALSDALDDLNRLHDVDADGFRADPIVRAAAERLLQVSVDLAVDVNAHLAAGVLGRAPTTGRESFGAMAEAGILSPGLADLLAPAAGLRNVLVHRYVDIDVHLVTRAVADILDLMPRYIGEVATFLRSSSG